MIQVAVGQSQLSGWGHYAEPTTLFIVKIPAPFMVGQTIDLTATKGPGGTQLHFTDGTILSQLESGNLVPALTGVRVWSVPAEGTTIPNGLDYVTIYASYTTKHGKTLNAIPVKVPVARPVSLRVVVPSEGYGTNSHPVHEEYRNSGSPLYKPTNQNIDTKKIKVYCIWKNSDGEVVRIEDVENYSHTATNAHLSVGGGYGYVYGMRRNNDAFDGKVYTDKTTETEVHYTSSSTITATATIRGIRLTTSDPGVVATTNLNLILINMPRKCGPDYDNRTVYTFTQGKNIGFLFDNGDFDRPVAGYNDMWLYFSTSEPSVFNTRETLTLNFYDGQSGVLYLARENSAENPRFLKTKYSYSCENGKITWTKEEE